VTIATTIGYVLAGLLATAIIFIGGRFLIAPRVAAAGYGVLPDLHQPAAGAYLSVKGVRDIATGLFVIILMAIGATHLLGWEILAHYHSDRRRRRRVAQRRVEVHRLCSPRRHRRRHARDGGFAGRLLNRQCAHDTVVRYDDDHMTLRNCFKVEASSTGCNCFEFEAITRGGHHESCSVPPVRR